MLRRLTILCVLACCLGAPASGQDAHAGQEPSQVSVASLQARLDAITADPQLTADAKAPLLEVLHRAIESARIYEARQQTLLRYASQRATVADRLAQRAAELKALEAKKPGPDRPDLKLAELEQGLNAAQAAQGEAQRQASNLEAERARRAERRAAIPKQIAEAQAHLDELPTQVPEVAGADARLVALRRLALAADRLRLQAEIDTLTAELQTYDAEVELTRTESDLAARRAAATKADADAWLAALQPMRAAEAQRAEADARTKALRADPRLQKLADGNAALAQAVAVLVERRGQAELVKAGGDNDLASLQQEFVEVKKRTELVGSTDAIGAMLRQRRWHLADTSRKFHQRTRSKRERIADAQLKGLEFDERRRRLVEDPDAWLQHELGSDGAALPAAVLEEAQNLRSARADLLQQLTEGYTSLLNTEVDIESTEHAFGDLIAKYRTYLTERVLSIRSAAPVWQLQWAAAWPAVAWLTALDNWREVGSVSLASFVDEGWPLALLALGLGLLALRFLLRRRLVAHGQRAARGNNVAYAPTALAALDTLLLAVPVPLLLWLWSWRLGGHPECSEFGKAIAFGAQQTALVLLLVLSVRVLVCAHGLAEAHFRWQSTTVAQLRRNVPLMLLSVLPFSFLLAVLEEPGDDAWLGSLGALLQICQLSLELVVLWRLLHPSRGIIGGGVKSSTSGFHRFRRLWFLLGISVPFTLLVMTLLGYQYTALQLGRRLQLTGAVLLTGVFVHALILRGLLLERRRLQIRRAEERLLAAKTGDAAASATDVAPAEEIDPQSLARQTQTLLRGGVILVVAVATFQIWVDVLPALGILRHVELWDVGTEAAPKPINLADALSSLLIVLASLVAARNLPALLELLVLQRMRMQAGERNAVTTLGRYGILIAGLVWAFSTIGIGWAKVQWLIAGVSVGLGFGMQEIFGNFVSGLILLLERPMRVGDLVTVGDVTGRVIRIRIRATTVQDWNRKELVVPNREFVSNRFVNWTLGDSIVRWVVPVGIAYGSDTGRALRLLEAAAYDSPLVLRDPPAKGLFIGFGDSALNLELRLFLDMNTVEWQWITDVHQAIDRRFREAGITISFPQRDVNLRLPQPVVDYLRGHSSHEPAT
ncbi:MAG TPA: mechanosensitive ion channel domain-containing protein [Planctomycetota bacterium]|nr:mechanosensitive ion channel domain-containing protein [Planctomycetota bacterium]